MFNLNASDSTVWLVAADYYEERGNYLLANVYRNELFEPFTPFDIAPGMGDTDPFKVILGTIHRGFGIGRGDGATNYGFGSAALNYNENHFEPQQTD